MKFLANTFLVTFIWRRYRKVIIAIFLLFLSYFLITLIHNDYVDYVRNSTNTAFLGLSYALKWLAMLLSTVIFYFYSTRNKKSKISNDDIRNLKKAKPTENTDSAYIDPFEKIRQKEKLKGKVDTILEGKQNQ